MAKVKPSLWESAGMCLALGAVLITGGGILISVGATERRDPFSLWDNGWVQWGSVVCLLGVVALFWSAVLVVAHRHTGAAHHQPAPAAPQPPPVVGPGLDLRTLDEMIEEGRSLHRILDGPPIAIGNQLPMRMGVRSWLENTFEALKADDPDKADQFGDPAVLPTYGQRAWAQFIETRVDRLSRLRGDT